MIEIIISILNFTGLDSMNSHYVKAFTNNQIEGKKLLNIRPYELEELGIKSIGHQEIILEAVEHLRNFVSTKILFIFINRKRHSDSYSTSSPHAAS